jgi:hypothetical protein
VDPVGPALGRLDEDLRVPDPSRRACHLCIILKKFTSGRWAGGPRGAPPNSTPLRRFTTNFRRGIGNRAIVMSSQKATRLDWMISQKATRGNSPMSIGALTIVIDLTKRDRRFIRP